MLWLGLFQPAAGGDARLQTVRRLIDAGSYVEAEGQSRALFDDIAELTATEAADARSLYLEALIRNGRGGEAAALALARALPADGRGCLLRGEVFIQSGDYRAANSWFARALAAEERRRPAIPPRLADALDGLARVETLLERYDGAFRHADRAVALRAQANDNPGLARSLAIRGFVWQRRDRLANASADLERALAIREAVAPRHPETARVLVLLGDCRRLAGDMPAARGLLARAVAIAEATLRPDHPDLAVALRNLAIPVHELGGIEAGRELCERALAIAERAHGPQHPLVAVQLNDLADSLVKQGAYVDARRLQQRALAIYERTLGPSHSYTITSVFNLAETHALLGDFDEAARLDQRAASTWERVMGPDHRFVAYALVGLGDVFASQGRHRAAIPLYRRALAVREKTLGATHDYVAETLTRLAQSTLRLGQTRAASAYCDRALQIWQKSSTTEGLAATLVVRAQLDLDQGRYLEARHGLEQALHIRRPLLGAGHPGVGEASSQLAIVLAALGERRKALATALDAERIGRDHGRLITGALPERLALTYAAARPRSLDTALSVLGDTQAVNQALDAMIRGRSLVLDEMAARQRMRASAAEAGLAPLFAAVDAARQRLANIAVRGGAGLGAAQYESLLNRARGDKEAAESALAERSVVAQRELARKEVGLEDVGAALPARSAIVSFVRYERGTFPAPGATDAAARIQKAPAYLAFVLRADTAAPAVVDLGAARSLDAAIARWRRELASGITPQGAALPGAERTLRTTGVSLRQRIWEPVATHLQNVDQVFVVPDGALNLLPLAALPSDATRYLVETGPTIHYLSAERDLVAREAPTRVAKGLLAVGGPAYGNTGGQAPAVAATTAQRRPVCGTLETITFPLLPASRFEAEDVTALWRRAGVAAGGQPEPASILTGANATEAAFKRSSPGRRILHLATHGFFLDPKCGESPSQTAPQAAAGTGVAGPSRTKRPAALFPESPLLQSGLALARANYRSAAGGHGEDGILTAEEVAGIDLDGVEWAVLSACDTGLGEIKAGEGVLGLRRAFQIAGVRTIVMSLWAVEDQAGRTWMRALYEGRLAARQSTADAVRNASLTVLRERRAQGLSTHPFYWGGFVAAGDWR